MPISGQLGSGSLGQFVLGQPGPLTSQQAWIQSFTASNYGPVLPGTAITLTWVSKFATTASIAPAVGSVATSGSTVVSPTVTTTYTLTVSDGVNPAQTRSLTIQVTAPAVFVRSAKSGPIVGTDVSCSMQLDLGDLVIVVAFSNTPSNSNDLNVTDSLGNIYHPDVQGGLFTFDTSPGASAHAGSMAIFSTIVMIAGNATITNTSSALHILAIAALEYVPAPGMAFAQGAKMIGDSAPDSGGPPESFGSGPYNYANSIIITAIKDGFGNLWSSVDGDTSRVQIPGAAFTGQGALGCAVFDAILAGPGSRNSNLQGTPIGGAGTFDFESPNILVAVYSAPLVRPVALDSQASVRGSLGSTIAGYAGQPSVDVSLGYLPEIGSVVFIAAEGSWDLTAPNLPAFQPSDTYGNIYARIVHWEGVVINGVAQQQAAAIYYTIVKHLPVSGVFTATVQMAPVNAGGPGCAAIAEYALGNLNPANIQAAILVNKTTEGSLSRFISGNITVSGRSLYAGFAQAIANAGNNVATPFLPAAGYTIDAQWNLAQVYVTPLNSWPRVGTGAWIHKYVPSGTYDGEGLTTGTQLGGITILAVPAGATLTIACPVGAGTAQVGVPYSAQVIVSGGTPPYTFAIVSGRLPPGLTLNPMSGIISGIPTLPDTFLYTVQVTDANGLMSAVTAPCQIIVTQNAPPFCIIVPVPTVLPTLVAFNEPLENKGS